MSGEPDNKPIKRVVARPIIKRRVQEATSPDDASKTDDVNSPTVSKQQDLPVAAPTVNQGVQSHSKMRAAPVATRPSAPLGSPEHRREFLSMSDDGYDEAADELVDVAKRSAPAWLISLGVHTSILVVLGLLMLPGLLEPPLSIEVVYAEKIGEQTEDEIFQSPTEEMPVLEDPVLSEDEIEVEDPLAAPPEVEPVEFQATNQTSDVQAPSIGMALDGREKGMKKALLAAYGGTAMTEGAVVKGLEWLKRHQQRDGMWSLLGNYADGAPTENRVAATAMALLAFQGHGSTHQYGPYKDVVARAWNALIKKQDAEGNFFLTGGHHHRLYTHAQATIALCELYGMTKDATLKDAAERALTYCYKAQSPQGGWRYAPGGASDTSVTGWFVMALQSGRMSGLDVPVVTLDKVSAFLDTATTDGGSKYAYIPGQSDTLSMTAEGLLCRQYLGWNHDDPRLNQGIQYVGDNPIRFAEMDVYYWYYATQALHHMGGKPWQDWNRVMRQAVPENQLQTGKEAGSWDPQNDTHGHLGGRLYTTCLCIYMLEVYYRHLPLYKHNVN
ncbi:MAG: prenyltransferase/squalene oxidase repeat-containing protein [Planctomycetaceae bacterium]